MDSEEIEFVEAFYTDEALVVPPSFYWVYRNGRRYYVDNDGNIRMGITSFLSAVMPENKYLKEWQKDVGEATAAEILRDRAKYGSTFHVLAADVLRQSVLTGKYNIKLEIRDLDTEARRFGFDPSYRDLIELQKDMASFAQWCEEYEPRPILLEAPLASNKMKLSATLDFFGEITIGVKGFYGEIYKSGAKKGKERITTKRQRVLAVCDFKTMRKKENGSKTKSIMMSNKLQLNAQRMFLIENYPEYTGKDIKMYNAIPSNWRTNPEMQMTEVEPIPDSVLTGLYEASRYISPDILEKIGEKITVEFIKYNGDISSCVEQVTFTDYCKKLIKRHNEKQD